MTYQESFSLALKLKDFLRLNEDEACIYFIFTNETDFYLQIFEKEPEYEIRHRIQHEAFYINKIPMARVKKTNGIETFAYRDLNLQLNIDLNTNRIIHFDGEESNPIDMSKVGKSLKKLTGKSK